jgi:hypothetical protein
MGYVSEAGVKLKTKVSEGPPPKKNATQWYTWAEQEMDQWGDETAPSPLDECAASWIYRRFAALTLQLMAEQLQMRKKLASGFY